MILYTPWISLVLYRLPPLHTMSGLQSLWEHRNTLLLLQTDTLLYCLMQDMSKRSHFSEIHWCLSAAALAIALNWVYVRGWPLFHSEGISEFFQLWPQTPSAFFGLWPPPSSRNASEFFLLWAPYPQHYHMLLPPQHLTQHLLQRLLWDLHLLQR